MKNWSYSGGLNMSKESITIMYAGNLGSNWFDCEPIQQTNKIYGCFNVQLFNNLIGEDY